MKRSLVSYERFEQMKENSLSTVVNELIEAQEHLARTLGTDSLVIESFDDNQVIYQKNDGTFVKASYSVEEDAVTFDDLEELVIEGNCILLDRITCLNESSVVLLINDLIVVE